MLLFISTKSHRRPHPDIVAVFECKGKKDFRQTKEKMKKVCKIVGFLLSLQPK